MIRKKYIYLGVVLMMTFATSAESIPDPCKLFTVEDVEKVMHIPMKPGRLRDSRSSFNGMTCTYFSKKKFEQSGSVSINIETTENMKETDHIFTSAKAKYERQKYAIMEALKRQSKADTFRLLKGLGDEAYWTGDSLRVLSKDTFLEIRVTGGFNLKSNNWNALEKQLEEKKLTISKEIVQRTLEKLGQMQ